MTAPPRDYDALLRRSLTEIRRLRGRLAAATSVAEEPIAVVGIGCRFPGALAGPSAYWNLLADARDAIGEVPADRWDVEALLDPDPNAAGRIRTRFGGFVEGPRDFDADFFRISPAEAVSVDPQQRLLLEIGWEALEHAGIDPGGLVGTATGVFMGLCGEDYYRLLASRPLEEIDPYMKSGTAHSTAVGRLSFFLGLRGPSLAVDTACSSSLLSVHLACASLRLGETDLALAGGVNRILSPEVSVNFSRAGMLAADGRCKTFDASADGYVRSEGCGVVVLRRLRDALVSGERVLAVVRGSAVNQDGRTSGLTVPHGPAQEDVLRAALRSARRTPEQVDYVEAHGTGTALGDPIELEALGRVFAGSRRVWVGSAKTNVGHLEGAAGVAGLIKTVLALREGVLPAHLHLKDPTPRVDWERLPLDVPTTTQAWPDPGRARLAGVSSFGFGGTNVHVVLEEWRPETPRPRSASTRAGAGTRPWALPLSARSAAALQELAGAYLQLLSGPTPPSMADLCFTASVGRAHLDHRLAVVGESVAALAEGLEDFLAGRQGSWWVSRRRLAIEGIAASEVDRETSAEELARRYVEGANLSWSGLFPPGEASPVDLPTYPFQRRRHWYSAGDAAPRRTSGEAASRAALASAGRVSGPHHGFAWRELPGLGDEDRARPEGAPKSWVVLAEDSVASSRAAAWIRARGARCREVSGHATALGELGAAALAEAAPLAGTLGVLYLAAAPEVPRQPLLPEALHARARQHCEGLLGVVRAALDRDSRLWIVTAGADSVDDAPPSAASLPQAALAGLARGIHGEHPELRCTRIDRDPTQPDATDPWMREVWLASSPRERELVLRGARRLVPRLVALPAPPEEGPGIHPEASYLLVGGLGGIGRHLATWLAEEGARYLAVMGRRGLDADGEAFLSGLAARGVSARYLQGDLNQREELEAVLVDLEASMPPLRGVLHVATSVATAPLRELDSASLEATLATKVLGTWNLHQATLDRPLDHFVVFSSVASFLGEPHLGAYAAANALVEALVEHRCASGLPALGLVSGFWKGLGLAHRGGAELQEDRCARGLLPMETGDALRWFGQAMALGAPRVALGRFDWRRVRDQLGGDLAPAFFDEVFPAGESPASLPAEAARPRTRGPVGVDRAASPEDRERDLFEVVRGAVAEVLEIADPEEVDPERGFFDLGMDSLLSLALRNRLQERLDCAIRPVATFEHSSVAKLVAHLATTLFPAVAAPGGGATRLGRVASAHEEPIAVVGAGCRFPGGADGLDAFWELLREGRDASGPLPFERWGAGALYSPDPDAPGKIYARRGGFLDRVDEFDAQLFEISPREAEGLDPQQRLLLEVAWETMEHAGIPLGRLQASPTGVFVGMGPSDYGLLKFFSGDLAAIDMFDASGISGSFASGRVSYALGLGGPSMTLDVACASSLVAVHLAARSLRDRECDQAFVGGVSLMLTPDTYVFLSRAKALSPDGRCKAFDASADGYARGEGCGVVLLKRLSDACADGDTVHALLRGSAVNHDGASSGLTVPSAQAQQRVLRAALADARVDPGEIDYVEAHGTGTFVGDPIEAEALGAVFSPGRSPGLPLRIGSVKSNIGHLEAGAGMAGLLKVVLALKHRQLPAHLHLREPNPLIDWDGFRLQVNSDHTPWIRRGGRRLAGVSSFGLNGGNAHVVLEEYVEDGAPLRGAPAGAPRSEVGAVLPLCLSAKTRPALDATLERYRDFLCSDAPGSFADLCFSAATTRTPLPHRAVVLASSRAEAAATLEEAARAGTAPGLLRGARPVHAGHGSPSGSEGDAAVAELYLRGAAIDWGRVDWGSPCFRVPLPGYPFQRRRYWIEGRHRRHHEVAVPVESFAAPEGTPRFEVGEPPEAARPSIDGWLCRLAWRQATATRSEPGPRRWLVVGDQEARGRALTRALEAAGARVLEGPGVDDATLAKVLREVAPGGEAVGLVYLAPGPHVPGDAASDRELGPSVHSACTRFLAVLQATLAAPRGAPLSVWLATHGVVPHAASRQEGSLTGAALVGLARTMALEASDRWGGWVDLDGSQSMEALAAELVSPGEDRQVALGPSGRFVARLAACDEPGGMGPCVRAEGAYLITGGLGGLGLEVARWLARQGARHLVLVGRRGAHDDTTRAAVAELEAQGVEVLALAADVAEVADAQRVVAAARGVAQGLRGIVHAAGVLDDGFLSGLDATRLRRVLAPKVDGAWNLHVLTQGDDLDLFVLFSSAAGLMGSPGQGNYAAANAFLDALAEQRRRQGLPGLSLAWGPWAEVGMAARLPEEAQARMAEAGLELISPEEGLRAMQRALSLRHGAVGVLPACWDTVVRAHDSRAFRALASELLEGAGSPSAPSLAAGDFIQRLQAAPAATHGALLHELAERELRTVLKLGVDLELDPRAGFFELGMNSLTGVEMVRRLERALGRSLPATLTFDRPTVESLATRLHELVSTNGGRRTRDVTTAPATAPAPAEAPGIAEVRALSERELEALIDQELESL